MAKIYGLFGSMKGKVADVVMAVRNGEQIVRRYQPVVSNPKTGAQIASRAKLKLLSQLSACYAPIIAIKRKGTISARNMFLKRNYEFAGYANDQADITLADVQLTDSAVPLAGFLVDRTGENMTFELTDDMANGVDRVVYVVVKKTSGQELILAGSMVVDREEGGGTFHAEMPKIAGDVVVMAYGIRINSEAAKVVFGNMTAPTAQDIARLLVTMNNADTALTFTETRGLQMASSENTAQTAGVVVVTITPEVSSLSTGMGTVSGGGRVAAGSTVTISAVANAGYNFIGWYNSDGHQAAGYRLSEDAVYSFVADDHSISVFAVFRAAAGE